MPKRIPIKVLKDLSKEQGLTHAILFAHDGDRDHIVTYGKSIEACSQTADYGNKLKDVLGWPESLQVEPSRVRRLQERIKDLKGNLKEAVELMERVRRGEYKPDFSTVQPWKIELDRDKI